MDTRIITLSDHCRFHLGEAPDAWQGWYRTTFSQKDKADFGLATFPFAKCAST